LVVEETSLYLEVAGEDTRRDLHKVVGRLESLWRAWSAQQTPANLLQNWSVLQRQTWKHEHLLIENISCIMIIGKTSIW
jgi:hypothetical protein